MDTKTTTSTPNPTVANASDSNINTAENTLNNSTMGKEYSGPLVAGISPNQQNSIDSASGVANNGTGAAASSLINQYAGAPASSVSPTTVASNMTPYMNQYVMQALAPQMRQMDISNANTNAAAAGTATSSGAFGDARAGIEDSNNRFNQNVEREGVIGNAYNSAFNTAIAAGTTDASNNLTAQTTNANLNETALNRALGGSQALEGLQTQQLGTQTADNALTQQDTAHDQATLTANYNNWLQAQQSQLAAQQSANQTVQAGTAATPPSQTTTDSKPDNSGLALMGTLGGAALQAFI